MEAANGSRPEDSMDPGRARSRLGAADKSPYGWVQSGKWIFPRRRGYRDSAGVGTAKPSSFLATHRPEVDGRFRRRTANGSPYFSNESGRSEDTSAVLGVHASSSGKLQDSNAEAMDPVWVHQGGKIFYIEPPSAISAVANVILGVIGTPGSLTPPDYFRRARDDSARTALSGSSSKLCSIRRMESGFGLCRAEPAADSDPDEVDISRIAFTLYFQF